MPFVHDVPKAGAGISHWVTNVFAPVQYPMGSHWHHFDQSILPPTVADDVHELPIAAGEHVLVYLPFEDQAAVVELLQQFPGQSFRVYSGTASAGEHGNVTLCRIGRKPFIEDLASSRGVICNAGFSLVSEALHLGKKVLVKPLTGQVEQESNALALEQLKLGRWMHTLCADNVREFLAMAAIAPCSWPQIMGRWRTGSAPVTGINQQHCCSNSGLRECSVRAHEPLAAVNAFRSPDRHLAVAVARCLGTDSGRTGATVAAQHHYFRSWRRGHARGRLRHQRLR